MPPEDAPEVLAVAAYISYLSAGEVIGQAPKGRGIPVLPDTGYDPNPATGSVLYRQQCSACHGEQGQGIEGIPPLWGTGSYNAGAGMNQIDKVAGFIWANMPVGNEGVLSVQDAKDIAAYIQLQYRPADPRESRLLKLLEKVWQVPESIIKALSDE